MRVNTTKCSVPSKPSPPLYRTVAAMKGDKTLIQESLAKDMPEEDARRLAEQSQANTAAVLRFEALESDLIEIVGVVNKIKKAVIWIIGILAANWIVTFWGSFEGVL